VPQGREPGHAAAGGEGPEHGERGPGGAEPEPVAEQQRTGQRGGDRVRDAGGREWRGEPGAPVGALAQGESGEREDRDAHRPGQAGRAVLADPRELGLAEHGCGAERRARRRRQQQCAQARSAGGPGQAGQGARARHRDRHERRGLAAGEGGGPGRLRREDDHAGQSGGRQSRVPPGRADDPHAVCERVDRQRGEQRQRAERLHDADGSEVQRDSVQRSANAGQRDRPRDPSGGALLGGGAFLGDGGHRVGHRGQQREHDRGLLARHHRAAASSSPAVLTPRKTRAARSRFSCESDLSHCIAG
jgi:hypothetical protein